MRTLPCQVEPLPGETPAGFFGRLAGVNNLDADALVHHLGRELGAKSISVTSPRFISAIEMIGGLSRGHFDQQRARFRLYRRCHHTGWALRRCAKCNIVDHARTACSTCSHGFATEVFSRGGSFCVRHRRWHFAGEDELVFPADACRRAEQALAGRLWSRGVTMHTGEFALAMRLILASRRESAPQDGNPLVHAYAAVVELLATLTLPEVALGLVALAESDSRQVEGLIGLTVGAGRGARTAELEAAATVVVMSHRAAMYAATHMPRSSGATVTMTPFEKGIAEAAYRERAVLLRHVTRAGHRVDSAGYPVRGAPASRVVSRRIVPGWADNAPQDK